MKKSRLLLLALLLAVGAPAAIAVEPTPVKRQAEFVDFDSTVKPETSPRPKTQTRPTYPEKFRGSGVVGQAKIAFIVDATGRTAQVQYLEATDLAFADAAIAAVKKWQFFPAMREGKPVASKLIVPMKFAEKN